MPTPADDFRCFSEATRVELCADEVRLMSVFGNVLRKRKYRGKRCFEFARIQAEQWSQRFEVPIRQLRFKPLTINE